MIVLRIVVLGLTVIAPWNCFAVDAWRVGFAKVDVTPEESVRLSGYASRNESSAGVADPLHTRAMVLSPGDPSADADSVVLISIDSIAVTSAMTVDIAGWLEEKYRLPRSQLVLCSTHSHAAPHMAGGLNNLYHQPSSDAQSAATLRYTKKMSESIKSAIDAAWSSRVSAVLAMGESQAEFAINRRVIQDGVWSGFGEQADGPVDRRVRVLQAATADGKLIGGAFLYACHCTTLGGDFNQVSGDWAGLAATQLEKLHASTVFLPVIGCGADANPNPRGGYDLAGQHAAEMIASVEAVLTASKTQPLSEFPVAHFGYAGLAPEQPTSERIEAMLASEQPNERRWAETMRDIKQKMGRLPETYPMPIHTWKFGDELTWVFLGGEVVVDYQFQIEKEFQSAATWVAAYTDDVFAYVASEAMRPEGGYEVDFSMIYYSQPGRWQSGTQSLIVRRVTEIAAGIMTEEKPQSAADSLQSLRVPDDFTVELVAGEPMVQDPINIAFGPDGRVWVVEMADYPLGASGGGRVKWMRDNDADGRLDEVHLFLDGLSYPTSVMPWREGALIIAAPNVLYAQDQDGDGRADQTEVLLSGVSEANPQHRASGFEIGLDGWLHFAAGSGTKELHSTRNGRTYEVHGRDVAWNPTTGEIRTTTGETQFVRSRDAFGNWFGNSNSRPIYQFVIEDRYLHGNSVSGGAQQDLLTPAVAPPVLPRSQTLDRFNDLYAHQRFTSACSSILGRVPGLESAAGSGGETVGLICEPVHNLVARIQLSADGASFTAERYADDTDFDFFTSTDLFSRPVRAINAPDGTIWIVDMTRKVIEHPEWIPTAWQERLDLRSGNALGRIYRVYRKGFHPTAISALGTDATDVLPSLGSQNGATRDLALQLLLDADYAAMEKDVQRMAAEHPTSGVRASALGALEAKGWLRAANVITALQDPDARIVRLALELSEGLEPQSEELQAAIRGVVARRLGPQVDLQWVLTASLRDDFDASEELSAIAARSQGSTWLVRGLSLIQEEQQALAVFQGLLRLWDDGESATLDPATFAAVESCATRLWSRLPAEQRHRLAADRLAQLSNSNSRSFAPAELLLLTVLASAGEADGKELGPSLRGIAQRVGERIVTASDDDQQRVSLINLIGYGLMPESQELEIADQVIRSDATGPVKQTIVAALRRLSTPQVSNVLLDAWPRLSHSVRSTACATLVSRREWVADLVSRLEAGTIAPRDLDLSTVQQLRSYRDRDLRARCIEVFSAPTPRANVVAQYLSSIPSPRTSELGEKLYKQECAACHQADPERAAIGPPLENLGHWTIDQWVTSILDPNRNVEPKYLQTSILTTSGQVLGGIVLNRSGQQLSLAASDGSIKEIALADIDEMEETGVSLMPDGFESKLTPQQLSEVLGYLRSR